MDKNQQFNAISNLISKYCDKDAIITFNSNCQNKPIAGFLLNPLFHDENLLIEIYSSITRCQFDPIQFYYDKEIDQLGKSIFHQGGAFYIMDPSSSIISYYLTQLIEPDSLVLDLCAAPGGKSIALSFRDPSTLILANDISFTRAKEIASNVERLGLANILSMSVDPSKLPDFLVDCVILDVPCSSSGMFRKEPKMLNDWSLEKVQRLLPIQANLLDIAYNHLKKGGIIAYSTCSLSIEEDEEQILSFLAKHSDCELIKTDLLDNMTPGKNNIGIHLIPGIYHGEGIYFAFIKKSGTEQIFKEEIKYSKTKTMSQYKPFIYQGHEYLLTKMYETIKNLPYFAPGLKVYDETQYAKCIFNHAYSKICQDIPLVELSIDETKKYLHGEELKTNSELNGLVVLTYKNLRLGFGKISNKRIKNYLPKGLRI